MKYFFIFSITLFLIFQNLNAQETAPFVRFPAISPDGNQIAFEYQGDIWKSSIEGGLAWRLTVHEAYDAYPSWNNDGSMIAFSGMRFGNYDVFLTSADGGFPQQLTQHSSDDVVSGWTPDGKILFNTRRTYAQVEWENEIYEISPDGGTPHRIMDALGEHPSASPNGRFIAFEKGACKITREDYRGPAQRDIWLYDTKKDEYTQLTNFDGNDFLPRFAGNHEIFYISPKSGKYNIRKLEIDDEGNLSDDTPVTDFNDDGIRYFSVDKTGNNIVFERQTSIFHLGLPGGSIRKISIEISPDYHFDPVAFKTFSDHLSEYEISPNGKYAALVIRGEIFVTAANDKKQTVSITNNPWRDRNVKWLNDSTLIFLSDREGQYDIYLSRSANPEEPDIFRTLKREIIRVTNTPEDELDLTVSPDGKKISFERGRGRLITAGISDKNKLTNETELLDGWASPSGVAWSPDSKWLAYSLVDLLGNNEIYIHAADNSQSPVNVSMHPRGDEDPVWSRDGSKLGFISDRNNGDADVWFVWLKKSDWEKTMQDWEEMDEDADAKKPDKKEDADKSEKPAPIQIDFDRIYDRLQQVTALPGNESDLVISDDGETFYF